MQEIEKEGHEIHVDGLKNLKEFLSHTHILAVTNNLIPRSLFPAPPFSIPQIPPTWTGTSILAEAGDPKTDVTLFNCFPFKDKEILCWIIMMCILLSGLLLHSLSIREHCGHLNCFPKLHCPLPPRVAVLSKRLPLWLRVFQYLIPLYSGPTDSG